MRTTIDIGDELLRRAKKRAAEEQTTLRVIVDRALRQYFSPAAERRIPLAWEIDFGRILPGVNLEDRDALYDLMESGDDRHRH